MSKLCLACMRRVPLLAGRCPYCRDENQGVHGRIILILLSVGIVFLLAHNTEAILEFIVDKPVVREEVKTDREISEPKIRIVDPKALEIERIIKDL